MSEIRRLEPGVVLDGFVLEEVLHRGGMSTLWQVSRPGETLPLLMKIPKLGQGEDPAQIVGFEMEQMIMPRLTGPHVPKFVAAGSFAARPYIVMERIIGRSLLKRLPELPLPPDEVAGIGVKVATALDDLHRQHVIHLDVKPSNIMMRESGEATLIDFGLSRHDQLPDLMQEEFRVPYGTAPYMAPEQVLRVRHEPRSDQFGLGVLLYFFATGVRPFGDPRGMKGLKRRLWRDPVPPRRIKADVPPWLQEVILRCLEVDPRWRYPTMAQLAFDLSHPAEVKLTQRAEKRDRDRWTAVLKRRLNPPDLAPASRSAHAVQLAGAPIIVAAVDLSEPARPIAEAVRAGVVAMLGTLPGARLACINVLKLQLIGLDQTLDESGRNKHVQRLVELKHWAQPLALSADRISYHVLEAADPAAALIEFAEANPVDHIVLGARAGSLSKTLLGSVSGEVAAKAPCTVTVVRPARRVGE